MASTSIFLDRSPSATAFVTVAMLRTWSVKLRACVAESEACQSARAQLWQPVRTRTIWLTLSVSSFQVPRTLCVRQRIGQRTRLGMINGSARA